MTTIDVRTQRKKEIDERRKKICSDYLNISNQNPDYKPYSVFRALGEKYGMTTAGIRDILIKNGLFQASKK